MPLLSPTGPRLPRRALPHPAETNVGRPARRLRTPRVFRHPARSVLAGFVATILLGAGLLSLPAATTAPGSPPFHTALFTSTSAVTVTGLITVDTAIYWTPFGQVVILLLIQLGGLGIMTSASLLFLVAGRRMGLGRRLAALSETQALDLGALRRLIITIAVVTATVETVVSLIVGARLWMDGRTVGEAAWEGAFHSISAFNNAGFSLYSDNLISLATDGWILIPLALAVIVGGLGFPVWMDLRARGRDTARWSLHTKLTLTATAILLALGTLTLTAFEWDNGRTLGQADAPGRVLGGFVAAVMPRTAGFSAVDYADVEPESLLVTDMLMLVGGGSGGTAGGLKVTTLVLLLLVVRAELLGDEARAFRRRIPAAAERQALTVAVLSATVVVLGTLLLVAGNDVTFSAGLFECLSAFATVGLSTGATDDLDVGGEAVLMLLMLIGRVGPLTLFVALVLRERPALYSLPEERPIVG